MGGTLDATTTDKFISKISHSVRWHFFSSACVKKLHAVWIGAAIKNGGMRRTIWPFLTCSATKRLSSPAHNPPPEYGAAYSKTLSFSWNNNQTNDAGSIIKPQIPTRVFFPPILRGISSLKTTSQEERGSAVLTLFSCLMVYSGKRLLTHYCIDKNA